MIKNNNKILLNNSKKDSITNLNLKINNCKKC